MPGSRVVHRAGAEGGRMPPVTRDSGGPEGRLEQAGQCPAFPNRARTRRASNWRVGTNKCEPQDAASTRKAAVTERPSAPTSILELRRHGGRRSVRPLRNLADFFLYPTAGIRYPRVSLR